MITIRLIADGLRLRIAQQSNKIASGNQNSVQIQVSFSGDWSDIENRSAVFFTSANEAVYEMLLSGGKCLVPHEVLESPGELYIGVRGIDPSDKVIKPTTLIKFRVEKGAPAGDATTAGPTTDVYQQMLARLNELEREAEDGITPHIGANGNWCIGETDTGVNAAGKGGEDGYTPQKGIDYYTDADKAEMVELVLAAMPDGDEVSY